MDIIKMEDEFFEEDSDALSLDDFSSGYISNPAVDSAVEFEVKKIIKLAGASLLGKKKDGTVFKKNLSNVDYGYEITTTDGSKYTVSSWEVFGKVKAIFQKLGKIESVKLKITHVLDGMKAENKKLDKYKVEAFVDGSYKSMDRDTKQWLN